MYAVKQSTALTIPVYVHDVNGDAVLSLVNAGFTKRISKGSGAFATMTVTVTEMENGWYSVPLSTAHTNTLGLITITLTHASSKQVNLQFRVEAKLVDDLNDIAATAIVSNGAIDTTGGAVDTVTTNTDMRGTDSAALATAMATAQVDLDTITGTDGVTLATAQGNYAPNVVVPDAAGVLPTAVENADALLDRNMSTGTDSGSSTVRTPRQALRFLRNYWDVSGTTLTVRKEDDSTTSWTGTVTTDAAADPITGSNPA